MTTAVEVGPYVVQDLFDYWRSIHGISPWTFIDAGSERRYTTGVINNISVDPEKVATLMKPLKDTGRVQMHLASRLEWWAPDVAMDSRRAHIGKVLNARVTLSPEQGIQLVNLLLDMADEISFEIPFHPLEFIQGPIAGAGRPDDPEEAEVPLTTLGSKADYNEYHEGGPDIRRLERFRSPASEEDRNPFLAAQVITIETSEVTSLCPRTGHPDWCNLKVTYAPDTWCVESKAFKVYLMGFRNFGIFHEAMVNQVCNELVGLLEPFWLEVEGQFSSRGGITFWPRSRYEREGVEPELR